MVKCIHCGSTDMELWGLAGSLKGDVKADGASLVCKNCGTMQPDSVLRELLQKKTEHPEQQVTQQ